MYFIPQRRMWYRSCAALPARVRYAITIGVLSLIIIGWRFGIYAWMHAMIEQDRAQYNQSEQQLIQYAQSETKCSGIACAVNKLRTQLTAYEQCSGEGCSAQLTALMDHAAKAGIQFTLYENQKETKKAWCTCQDVKVGFTASLDVVNVFLKNLSQSHAMIECNQISCESQQNGLFTVVCGMRFVSVADNVMQYDTKQQV